LLRRLGVRLEDNRLTARWVHERPYSIPPDEQGDYISYRQRVFADFVRKNLSAELRKTQVDMTIQLWHDEETLSEEDRSLYQEQMSLLSTLEPTAFNDIRMPFDLTQAHIGVIWQNEYYLVPLTHNGVLLDMRSIRPMAHAILSNTLSNRKAILD